MKKKCAALLACLLIAAFVPSAYAFDDVPEDAWYREAVEALEEKNIVQGIGGNLFEPERPVSRGEFCKMLALLAEYTPLWGTDSPFADVKTSDWYAPYVIWCAHEGLVLGDGVNFRPNESISRQDMAVIVHRFLAAREYALPNSHPAPAYSDASDIASYAAEPIYLLRKAGLLPESESYAPLRAATRAETAHLLGQLLGLEAPAGEAAQ